MGLVVPSIHLRPAATALNVIQPSVATVTPLTLRGFTSQSANLIEYQSNAGTILGRVGAKGHVLIDPTDDSLAALRINQAALNDYSYLIECFDVNSVRNFSVDYSGVLRTNVNTEGVNAFPITVAVYSVFNPLGAGANGYGNAVWYTAEDSTTESQTQFVFASTWVDATHASRKARVQFSVYDTTEREALRFEATGTAPAIGFLGASAIVRPASTTDLRQALINLGLYTTGGATPLDLNGGNFTTTGTVSSPGAGANSEKFGLTALAAGASGVSLGNGASAAHQGAIVLGHGAVSTAVQQLIIGSANGTAQITEAYMGSGVTAASPAATALYATGGFGTNIAGAALSIAGGKGTGTGVGGNIVFQYAPIGVSGSGLNSLSTAVTISGTNGSISCPGAGASSQRFGLSATAAGGQSVALGELAQAQASSGIVIGYASGNGGAGGSNSIAIGNTAGNGNLANSIAMGQGAGNTAANQCVFAFINNMFIGAVTAGSPAAKSLNASGGSGTDNAGASLTIAGGRGTGAAVGGDIIFQSTVAGASASTARTLQEKARISNVGVVSLSQESSTQTRTVMDVTPSFATATDASRKARAIIQIYDTAAREAFRIEADGSNPMIGFLGAAAVVRAAAFTQTYSTSDRTHNNVTSSAVATTGASDTDPRWAYTTQAQADAIPVAINAVAADLLDLKQLVNAVIDDLQAYGLQA